MLQALLSDDDDDDNGNNERDREQCAADVDGNNRSTEAQYVQSH